MSSIIATIVDCDLFSLPATPGTYGSSRVSIRLSVIGVTAAGAINELPGSRSVI